MYGVARPTLKNGESGVRTYDISVRSMIPHVYGAFTGVNKLFPYGDEYEYLYQSLTFSFDRTDMGKSIFRVCT